MTDHAGYYAVDMRLVHVDPALEKLLCVFFRFSLSRVLCEYQLECAEAVSHVGPRSVATTL